MRRAFSRSRFSLLPTSLAVRNNRLPSSSLIARTGFLSSFSNPVRFSTTEALPSTQNDLIDLRQKTRKLPLSCPGCGAPSQVVASKEAGFYTLSRSAVKKYVQDDEVKVEDRIYEDALNKVDKSVLEKLGLGDKTPQNQEQAQKTTPICDRCHNLLHHHTGVPIFHPSVDSIHDIIEDSPHKHNHIYHVLDASDFPMSLIPNLMYQLELPPLRTQNRRSKHLKYFRDRVAQVSFIITRSDLLAPNKEQVDSLMPYLREVLRDALGHAGKNVRLGNLRCVSSKRGWWTKEVKEDIWERGGAAWMVGKVNVGKSNLFEVVFPKGRGQDAVKPRVLHSAILEPDTPSAKANTQGSIGMADFPSDSPSDLPSDLPFDLPSTEASVKDPATPRLETTTEEEPDLFDVDEASLLPPAQPETAYPVMPVISSLPGTTASPIRVPFGSGKGELIDLPGVARSNLDEYVIPEHRQDLVMRARVVPEQLTIKPGQSLLLGGGLIRITPKTPDMVFLSYSFMPLKPHITSTEKAEAMATGERAIGIHSIMTEEAREALASAGDFRLNWDVTRKRAGPLTSPSAAKLKPDQLPFKIYSADILIEGVGWVELVAQVRTPKKKSVSSLLVDEFADSAAPTDEASEDHVSKFKPLGVQESGFERQTIPTVEVFTPKGKFVGVRPPMNAWSLGGKKQAPANARKSRPRMSMKSFKHSQRGRETQMG